MTSAKNGHYQELETTALQVELKNVKAERDGLVQEVARLKEHRDKLQNIINTIQVAINQ